MASDRKPRIIRSRPGSGVEDTGVADSGVRDFRARDLGDQTRLEEHSSEPRVEAHPISHQEDVPPLETPDPGAAKVTVHSIPTVTPSVVRHEASGEAQDAHASDAPGEAPGAAHTGRVLKFPEPTFKRRRRIAAITAGAVVLAMAIVMVVVLFTPIFALKTVTVDGTKILQTTVVQAALKPIMGKSLTAVTENQVRALLEPIPQINSVTIEARPPSTLLVHVVERVPVALLKDTSGYLLVDPDGVKLGSTPDPASVALPLIDGGTAVIGQANFKAITAVLAVLPPAVLGKLLTATASSPDAVQLKLDDGKTVIWGDSSQQTLKAQVLQALISAPPTTPAPSIYDISSPRYPVTR